MNMEIVAKISKINNRITISLDELNTLTDLYDQLILVSKDSEEASNVKEKIEKKQLSINKLYEEHNRLIKDI